MKMLVFAAFSLALAACGKPSVDERFTEMYEYQKKHDPKMAALTAKSYQYRDSLSDQHKLQMIEVYETIREGRERLGLEPAQ